MATTIEVTQITLGKPVLHASSDVVSGKSPGYTPVGRVSGLCKRLFIGGLDLESGRVRLDDGK
jgi:hypothetical protein